MWLHVINIKRAASPEHASLLDSVRGTVVRQVCTVRHVHARASRWASLFASIVLTALWMSHACQLHALCVVGASICAAPCFPIAILERFVLKRKSPRRPFRFYHRLASPALRPPFVHHSAALRLTLPPTPHPAHVQRFGIDKFSNNFLPPHFMVCVLAGAQHGRVPDQSGADAAHGPYGRPAAPAAAGRCTAFGSPGSRQGPHRPRPHVSVMAWLAVGWLVPSLNAAAEVPVHLYLRGMSK